MESARGKKIKISFVGNSFHSEMIKYEFLTIRLNLNDVNSVI